MNTKKRKERRSWPRETVPTSEVGIVYPQYDEEGKDVGSEDMPDTLLVPVLNRSEGGGSFGVTPEIQGGLFA